MKLFLSALFYLPFTSQAAVPEWDAWNRVMVEIETIKQKTEDLQAHSEKLRAELASGQKALGDLQKRKTDLLAEVAALLEAQKQATAALETLRVEKLQPETEKLVELNGRREQNLADLKSTFSQIEGLKKEIDTLTAELTKLLRVREAQGAGTAEFEREFEGEAHSPSHAEEKFLAVAASVDEAKLLALGKCLEKYEDCEVLRGEESAKSRERWENQVSETRRRLRLVQDVQVPLARRKLEATHERVSRLRSEVSKLEDESKTQRATLADLTRQRAETERQISEIQADQKSRQEHITRVDAQAATLQTTNTQVERRLAALAPTLVKSQEALQLKRIEEEPLGYAYEKVRVAAAQGATRLGAQHGKDAGEAHLSAVALPAALAEGEASGRKLAKEYFQQVVDYHGYRRGYLTPDTKAPEYLAAFEEGRQLARDWHRQVLLPRGFNERLEKLRGKSLAKQQIQWESVSQTSPVSGAAGLVTARVEQGTQSPKDKSFVTLPRLLEERPIEQPARPRGSALVMDDATRKALWEGSPGPAASDIEDLQVVLREAHAAAFQAAFGKSLSAAAKRHHEAFGQGFERGWAAERPAKLLVSRPMRLLGLRERGLTDGLAAEWQTATDGLEAEVEREFVQALEKGLVVDTSAVWSNRHTGLSFEEFGAIHGDVTQGILTVRNYGPRKIGAGTLVARLDPYGVLHALPEIPAETELEIHGVFEFRASRSDVVDGRIPLSVRLLVDGKATGLATNDPVRLTPMMELFDLDKMEFTPDAQGGGRLRVPLQANAERLAGAAAHQVVTGVEGAEVRWDAWSSKKSLQVDWHPSPDLGGNVGRVLHLAWGASQDALPPESQRGEIIYTTFGSQPDGELFVYPTEAPKSFPSFSACRMLDLERRFQTVTPLLKKAKDGFGELSLPVFVEWKQGRRAGTFEIPQGMLPSWLQFESKRDAPYSWGSNATYLNFRSNKPVEELPESGKLAVDLVVDPMNGEDRVVMHRLWVPFKTR